MHLREAVLQWEQNMMSFNFNNPYKARSKTPCICDGYTTNDVVEFEEQNIPFQ